MIQRKHTSGHRVLAVVAFAAAGLFLGGCDVVPGGGTIGAGGGQGGGFGGGTGGGGQVPSLGSLPTPPVPLPGFGAGGTTLSPQLPGGDASKGTAGPSAPADLGGSVPTAGRTAFEVEVDRWMLAFINAERQAVNAQPLKVDARLHEAAWKHNLEQFQAGKVDHQNSRGEWGHDRAQREGFPVPGGMESVNENVADIFARTDAKEFAQTAINMYRQSDGHWKNLIDPKWNVVGLASIYRPEQAKRDSYGETVNPNTQLFGRL